MASGPHTLHFLVDEARIAVRSGAAAWEPLLVLGDSVSFSCGAPPTAAAHKAHWGYKFTVQACEAAVGLSFSDEIKTFEWTDDKDLFAAHKDSQWSQWASRATLGPTRWQYVTNQLNCRYQPEQIEADEVKFRAVVRQVPQAELEVYKADFAHYDTN